MIYKQNPDYRVLHDPDSRKVYFSNQNGARIRTDFLTALIWQKAGGRSLSDIRRAVSENKLVSIFFLETTLKLMIKADLLFTKGEATVSASLEMPKTLAESLISVIIVNYNGRGHLGDLLESLENQSYQNIEILLIDNCSKDDSVTYVRQNWPRVKVIEQRRNLGFAAGNNVGIRAARGDYLFLVNNDTKLDSYCLANLMTVAGNKPEAAAIVPKLKFFLLPAFINAIGNSVSPIGWGSDNYIGHLDIGQFDQVREVFSACFGAVLLDREALDKVGLLDEAYRFYYEDSDWSYRARLLGFKIYLAPHAVVYHKFNATMNTLSYDFKLRLLVGNRLRFALKNLSLRSAFSFSRNYVKEDARHFLGSVRRFNFGRAFTYLRAWLRFLVMLPGIAWRRRQVQRRRQPEVIDKELFKLFPDADIISMLDEDSCPYLDTKTIRKIYLHQLLLDTAW